MLSLLLMTNEPFMEKMVIENKWSDYVIIALLAHLMALKLMVHCHS